MGRQGMLLLAAFILLWVWGLDAARPVAAQRDLPLGFHIHRGDGAHLAAAQAAGGEFVVLVLSWEDIEPTPGYFYWEKSDAALAAAAFHGLGVVARLDRPPVWARTAEGPVPWRLDAYAAFVGRAVARYGARLDGVLLWNEPNLRLEWDDQTPDAAGYVALLAAGYGAAKAAQPDLPVVMAGLAFTRGDGSTAVNDLEFLRDVYALGGAAYFDVLAAHPYGFGAPPTAVPDVAALNFRRLELHRALMEEMGDGATPVWITEMGWRTSSPNPADAWQVVTPEEQALYTQAAWQWARDNYPWVERLALWELVAGPDLYGYALWQGAGRMTPAYDALVAAARARCGGGPCPLPGAARAGGGAVTALAADVAVRLGDIGTLHPHWVHLYRGGKAFSPRWVGEFYLSADEATTLRTLVLETMQVDQPTSWVYLNDQPVGRLLPRARLDPTSTWVTQRLAVPDGALRAGRNTVRVEVGLRNPARQYRDWRWENMQVRHLRLLTAEFSRSDGPAAWDWAPLDNPPGWGEVARVRAEAERLLWVTTNRAGGVWRAELAADGAPGPLVNRAGAAVDVVFTDVRAWRGETWATTDQGLRRLVADGWAAVETAPARYGYVLAVYDGRLWAGFEGDGVWATTDGIHWQRAGLSGLTALDLAEDAGGALWAATQFGVYRLREGRWARLPDLTSVAEDASARFVGHLYADEAGGMVVRSRDRLWRWTEGAGWRPFGPEEVAGRSYVAVGCCGVGTLVGTNEAGLWRLGDADWSREPGDWFEDVEVTHGLRAGMHTILGTTNGVFVQRDGDAAWRAVGGLAPVVTGLVVDPQRPGQWLAATPVGVFAADEGGAWTPVSPGWVVWDVATDAGGRVYAARGDGLAWSDDARKGVWGVGAGMESVTFFRTRPSPFDLFTVWAGSWGNNVGRSGDRGASLTPLHNGLETLSALDVWWHATPGQVTLATIEGLYRTDDGGATWFRLPGALAQQTIYALWQDAGGTLWAGAADGLWASVDYGVTWARQAELPPTAVVSLGALADGTLWAGTEGDGLWARRGADALWWQVGLAGRTVYALAQLDGQMALAATDGGLWRAAVHVPRSRSQ